MELSKRRKIWMITTVQLLLKLETSLTLQKHAKHKKTTEFHGKEVDEHQQLKLIPTKFS